jgi:hypothetical protein
MPRDTLADWRRERYTDLAQALWWGERMLRSIVKQPPGPRVAISPVQGLTFNRALKLAGRDRAARARI